MDLGLDGRVALVMGASRGIGRAVAVALAREGATVAVVSRSAERLEEVVAEIGAAATAFVADASDPDRMSTLPGEVEAALGPIDVLLLNTGGPPLGQALDHDLEEWEEAYRSLVLAPRILAGALVPGMRERGWGRIVNVTSIATKEPIPGLLLSNSHRLATVGAFKTLSRELARAGILLNGVAPGRIATDRIASMADVSLEELRKIEQPDIPVGRLGTPEEFGDVVAFLCSERASYVNGVNLLVDGGLTRGI
jgi:3-oxoacyl-[acyl-carrier protein] reductase